MSAGTGVMSQGVSSTVVSGASATGSMAFVSVLMAAQAGVGRFGDDYYDDMDVYGGDQDECYGKTVSLIGLSFSYLSALMYLSSRIPQLKENIERQSVEGLSIGMFTVAILGNFFYGLSIFLNPSELADLTHTLPFLIGSLGTMAFDCTIFCQFWYYGGDKKAQEEKAKEKERDMPDMSRDSGWNTSALMRDDNV